MRKNITSLFSLLLCAGMSVPFHVFAYNDFISPDQLKRLAVPESSENVVSLKSLPKVELAENEKWWGYFNGDFKDNTVMSGNSSTGEYLCCVKVPSVHQMGKGRTIEGVSFSFPSRSHIDSVKVWISETLPSSSNEADVTIKKIKKSDIVDLKAFGKKSNEVRFDKPFMIGDKDVYVGYSFVVKDAETEEAANPILMSKYPEKTAPNALFFKVPGEGWSDVSGYPFGNLALQMLMSRKSTQNAVAIQPYMASDLAGKKGTEEKLSLQLKNEGERGCSEFSYVVTNGAGDYAEKTVKLDEKVTGLDKTFDYAIDIPINEQSGKDTLMIRVTKVNGVKNESVSHTQCNGNMFSLSRLADHNVLVEYFVGTWDGHSPRAYVSMDRIKETYGDHAVVASVHAGKIEPMGCLDYSKMTDYYKATTGFPTAFIDRTINNVYPYWGEEVLSDFGFEDLFLKIHNKVALAEVSVESSLSDDKKVLTVKSSTNFLCENTNGDYAVAYILTADSLSGKGEGWDQANQTIDFKDTGVFDADKRFDWWMNSGATVKNYVFNNVAIAAKGMLTKGLDGSLTGPFKEGAVKTHAVEFNLDDYVLVSDVSKLKVAAVVFDRKNGFVVNAVQAPVGVVSGIDDVILHMGNLKEVARYSISGRRLNGPTKGVNLVKYSDGSLKKVIVK